jgi:hypothetical protein
MEYRKNIMTGGVLLAFSGAYLALSTKIRIFRGAGAAPLDSAFVPRFWGLCLLLLSLSLLLRGLRERKREVALHGAPEKSAVGFGAKARAFIAANYEAILTFAIIAVYTALIDPVGFLIMSILYLFAQILILSDPKKRNLVRAGIMAVVASVAVDYIFVQLLHVMLPRGIFGF